MNYQNSSKIICLTHCATSSTFLPRYSMVFELLLIKLKSDQIPKLNAQQLLSMLNAICFTWYVEAVIETGIVVRDHKTLCKLATDYISAKVMNDPKIKMKKITFFDLELNQYENTAWMVSTKTQWTDLPHSKFPSFAGKDVHKINDTVYYV